MNHHQQVPVLEMDGDDYSPPANRPGNFIMSENDDVMELVWQDGKVVMLNHSQNRQAPPKYDNFVLPEHITAAAPPPESHHPPQLFMHEDEMATWLNYPLPHNMFSSQLFYNNNNPPPSTAVATNMVMESMSTVVESNDTPLVGPGSSSGSKTDSRLDSTNNASSFAAVSVTGFSSGERSLSSNTSATAADVTCDTASPTSLTSSTGGGGSTTSASLRAEALWGPGDRKRKGKEPAEDTECYSEEVECESGSKAKKEAGGSTSTKKRSGAAEVHNLSERKRRERINEKMKSLQVMIPRCNKADKASMLDEAIEYVKTLQSQVQMMSIGGCDIVPMMFPGVHPYMPMGMAPMEMGVGMGMNLPIMPYGSVLAGNPMPPAPAPAPAPVAAAAHMGTMFPIPANQMPVLPPNDPNRAQATSHSDQISISGSFGADSQSQSPGPNSSDPHQQYPTSQQMLMQLQQNQAMAQPSFSKGPENRERHQPG